MDSTLEEIISDIFTASRLIRENTSGHGKSDRPSIVHLKILSIVSEKVSPTMREVADRLYITPPSATAIVEGLVKENNLERIFDENDRRIVRLKITKRGEKTLKEQKENVFMGMTKVFDILSEKEKNEFSNILKKIIKFYKR
jgi:DNA-binding MarR family transcriptional regulator